MSSSSESHGTYENMTSNTALPISDEELNRFISKAWLKRFAFARHAYRIAVELRSLRAPSNTRIAVKPLKWGKTSYGSPEAITVVGVYRINSAVNGGWSVTVGHEVLRDVDGRTNFATLEAAHAAAQANYERRIFSTLASIAEGGGSTRS